MGMKQKKILLLTMFKRHLLLRRIETGSKPFKEIRDSVYKIHWDAFLLVSFQCESVPRQSYMLHSVAIVKAALRGVSYNLVVSNCELISVLYAALHLK